MNISQEKLIFKHWQQYNNNCKLYSQGRDCLLKNGDDLAAAVRPSHGKINTWYSGPSLVLHVTWGIVRSFWVCLAAVLQTQNSYEFRSKSRHVEKHISDEIAAVQPHDFVRRSCDSSTKPCGVFLFKKSDHTTAALTEVLNELWMNSIRNSHTPRLEEGWYIASGQCFSGPLLCWLNNYNILTSFAA